MMINTRIIIATILMKIKNKKEKLWNKGVSSINSEKFVEYHFIDVALENEKKGRGKHSKGCQSTGIKLQ